MPRLGQSQAATNENSSGSKGNEKSPDTTELTSKERFNSRPPRFKLQDLILAEAVLSELTTLQSRIQNHAVIYKEWEFDSIDPQGNSIAVNLYGPPGTGKTMCAEAIAHQMSKRVIEVNYAEIESKYVGETPKNIVAAFTQAKADDAMLFFDEADSILGRRMTNVTQSADHSVNVSRAVMLKQLDSFPGIVVFATNLAKNYDGAFVRRILQHVFIGPPDHSARRRLWDKMISNKVPGRHGLNFEELAASSAGLTGGHIKNVVLLALASVANRIGEKRLITMDDLKVAMDGTKRAQREVGAAFDEWDDDSSEAIRQFHEGSEQPNSTAGGYDGR